MEKINVILVFDIGKTNKKVLLFDQFMKIRFEEEIQFPEVVDDDDYPCDDTDRMEKWIDKMLDKFISHEKFNVIAVNFTTYGASLAYLDENGKRIAPVYNYLKPMPETISESVYKKHGEVDEFSRNTASPALGFLNSGLQILWLKKTKPEVYTRIADILHFPQYMAYRLNHKITSEHTSIGCHTAMWDFDRNDYHPWLKDEGIRLPEPEPVETVYDSALNGKKVKTGIGIHDSSASLVPYLLNSKEEFILLSTGTWCISSNPFNHTPLTAYQLQKDCLCYMSIYQKPVKSSRVFLGHIHDVNVKALNEYFKVTEDQYKKVKTDEGILKELLTENDPKKVFFRNGMPEDYLDKEVNPGLFKSFDEAYHRLMIDLTGLVIKSLALIIPENDKTKDLYISGGFAKNELFVSILASWYKNKYIYTSEVSNATSLGAALVLYRQFGFTEIPKIDLGLRKVESFSGLSDLEKVLFRNVEASV